MSRRRTTQASVLPVLLTQVVTRDGVTLAGAVIEPPGKKHAALIYVHGLTSSFTAGHAVTEQLSAVCRRAGYGFYKFNNRGHDIVARAGKRLGGGGFEKFTDCIKDIDAVIALARRRGYRRFVLIGHSTGANKALYYAYRGRTRLAGLALTGPISDIAGTIPEIGQAALKRLVATARKLAARDPQAILTDRGRIRSAARTLSLYEPGQAEDVFQYYRTGRWPALRSVRCPLLVVIGERDPHLDRPAAELLGAFRQHATTPSFTASTITGADHSFHGYEREFSAVIGRWLRSVVA